MLLIFLDFITDLCKSKSKVACSSVSFEFTLCISVNVLDICYCICIDICFLLNHPFHLNLSLYIKLKLKFICDIVSENPETLELYMPSHQMRKKMRQARKPKSKESYRDQTRMHSNIL